ncbi:MAG TPA: hypothetical protein VII06_06680 [Chloroflexota bacterium]
MKYSSVVRAAGAPPAPADADEAAGAPVVEGAAPGEGLLAAAGWGALAVGA